MVAARSRKARADRRRRKRVSTADNDLTPAHWDAIKQAWGGCAYCGVEASSFQKDCVQAISRGGRYTLDNVVPVCSSCNASKCNSEVTTWLRRKRLDERRFLERFVEINRELAVLGREVRD